MHSFALSKLVTDLPTTAFRLAPHHNGGVSYKTKKTVLRVLADHYPNIWPSVKLIANLGSLSIRQTQKAIRDLERDGYIRAITSKAGGDNSSVQYEINVNQIRVQVEIDDLNRGFEEGLTETLGRLAKECPPEQEDDEATGWIIQWNLQHPYTAGQWSRKLSELPQNITGWYPDFLEGKTQPANVE
jgi:hypothetical protein